jgi:peptidoglycan/LPS O-acetylase OafA/YrhL
MKEDGIKKKQTGWINGLDSIRFVLALIVFLSHLENPWHEYLLQSHHFIFRAAGMLWGVLFSGVGSVMAFFIISGFVIHYPNRDNYPSTLPFLIRRWLRIGLPLIVISLIAGKFNQFSAIPIWSLYCELIYYTLYPLLIRIKLKWTTKFWLSFLLSLVIIAMFAPNDRLSFIHQKNVGYNGAYWQLGDLFTWIVGLPCWLLGVVMAQGINEDKGTVSTMNIYLFRVGVLGIGIGLDILKFHFFLSYFFSMNFFAIVLFFWIKKEILYHRDRPPVSSLEFLGKFSYSLYLCHNVFSFFILKLVPMNIYTYFLIILIVILSSYFFYLLVERPSHLLSRRLSKIAGSRSSTKWAVSEK